MIATPEELAAQAAAKAALEPPPATMKSAEVAAAVARAIVPSVPPTTTAQQDLTTAGQRHINVMWERTQQVIAIAVSLTTLFVCAYLAILGRESSAVTAFMLLSNGFFLIVGTYFQRTNHTKTGGVGPHDQGR